ncbi:MAG: LysR family transcriptional regulator, partial [Phycisphaerales bacterium]
MDIHDLSIRDLVGVEAVARHGHFGRAAEELGIAQPTLSAQVSKVERALGSALFERTGRSFLVTPSGARLLPLVRAALAGVELLGEAAGAGGAGRDGGGSPMRLGVIPTLGAYLMPHLLGALRGGEPG